MPFCSECESDTHHGTDGHWEWKAKQRKEIPRVTADDFAKLEEIRASLKDPSSVTPLSQRYHEALSPNVITKPVDSVITKGDSSGYERLKRWRQRHRDEFNRMRRERYQRARSR